MKPSSPILRYILLLSLSAVAGAQSWPPSALPNCNPCTAGYTCYYADSNASGTGSGTLISPWKHLFSVRAQTFASGSMVCLKRGSVWYGEHLRFTGTRCNSNINCTTLYAVTSDGTIAAPFAVDAYGSGPPPILNAEYSLPSSGMTWTCGSPNPANVCSATIGSPDTPYEIDMARFGIGPSGGQVWGQCQGQTAAADQYCLTPRGSASPTLGTAALAHNGDFYYPQDSGVIYVYDSSGSNPVTDLGGIALVEDGALQLFLMDGVNYVSIQHVELLNHSWYGLEYRGNAGTDDLAVSNLYSDTEVPFNFHGTGFYVHPAAASANLFFYNDEAHRGFYGFSFECAALPCTSGASVASGGATLVNVKAYFNRSYGLNDATFSGTAAHYSYAHFYGNQIKWPLAGEVNGGVAGANVISNLADPAVKKWKLYVPRVALNFGDVGRQNGADTAFNTYTGALGVAPVSIGVATNFPIVPALVTQIQTWVNAGYDISLLGLSDASYQNANALIVQYTGAGSAAAMTISGYPTPTLTIAVTGASDGVSYSLTSGSYLTIQQVEFALRATGKYTATLPQPCSGCSWISGSAMLSKDFAGVSGVDVKTALYTMALDPAHFLNDELAGAKAWIAGNLTGTSGKFVYWYPGLLFCNSAPCAPLVSGTPEAYTVSNSYDLARGTLSMQAGSDGIQGGYDLVAAAGIDSHGMVACEMGGWNALTPVQLAQTIQVLAEKSAVWGVPYLCYFQPGTLSNVQLARAVADLGISGVTLMTDSTLATFLEAKKNVPGGSTSYAWGPDGAAGVYDGSESYLSPTVGAGSTLTAAYQYDVWGRQQAQFRAGWDIGSQVLVPTYLGLRPGH
jgi:hypothetical protein